MPHVWAIIKPFHWVQANKSTLLRSLIYTSHRHMLFFYLWLLSLIKAHKCLKCIMLYLSLLTNEESETKSPGVSGGSGCRRESQESEAGVRGRGFKLLGLWHDWNQELMQTRASAASRSLDSGTLHNDCSLSCLLLSIYGLLLSIWAPWETQEYLILD